MATDLERALTNGSAPWKTIEYRCKDFWIFEGEPPHREHDKMFVPTHRTMNCLAACYKGAYTWGYNGIENEHWKEFTIVHHVSTADTQYPCIILTPYM
jgi:hypothetical protein